ncbi:phosphosulfolactate synthase [Desertibacillus haloalkaliphilus]|uniref:phosphosulfolactate synthase n=1 Tax=Desertibacillus haloalkaliphilus TaxID=1328930 RepID=UPI001C27E345|nr:phosphosulfolactate synthase [Desertibacillus haloalkaliphilus]MBU8906850.1 phosphosulfolactate synthase [Desertibacillus haloalkaliphilus]
MNSSGLTLPTRFTKPRSSGLTLLIDNGVPTELFKDTVISNASLIDFVKFGWGTSIISSHLEEKIECLQTNEVEFFFGGTLFEKFVLQRKIDQYYQYCNHYGCRFIEISNGTIELSNSDKATFITDFSKDFTVLSEVGSKSTIDSLHIHPSKWIEYINEDLEAGAYKVITEARESGTSGICRSDGEIRFGLIEEIIQSTIHTDDMIFEAPTKQLQTYFIEKLGSNVNLANIPFTGILSLETLRLGLRSDTLSLFEQGGHSYA